MIAIISLGILVGLDNLRVSTGLGALKLDPRRRWGLVAAFGLCEALMPLLGLALGRSVLAAAGDATKILGPLALGTAGALAIYSALRGREVVLNRPGRWLLWLLPLALSLDNLLAGVSLNALPITPLAAAMMIGAISSLLAMAGLALGDFAGRRLPIKAELVGGLLMIGVAFML